MFLRLLLLFTLIPVAELYLFIKVGSRIGALATIAIVILTGVVGAALARAQGLGAMRRIQEATARGEMPADEMIDAVFILVAGLLLLTPGFLTDALGVLLLVPATRALVRRWLAGWLRRAAAERRVIVTGFGMGPGGGMGGGSGGGMYFGGRSFGGQGGNGFRSREQDGDVYDVEFRETGPDSSGHGAPNGSGGRSLNGRDPGRDPGCGRDDG
ncbi:MAG: FxsA family protein [Desulfovibrionaceae bacterium]|jgi:UPF0716 protein FxsA|nr:FxsA family protein [Desulfovibrionaceae bacterium]